MNYDFAFQQMYLENLGRITLRVTPNDAPEDAVEALIETYPGMWGLFGGDIVNPLPTEENLSAVESPIGACLCDDHRHFLKQRNGVNWTWWRSPDWNTKIHTNHMAFITALNTAQAALPDIGLLQDTTDIFAAGNGNPYLSYPDTLADMGFYDATFLRFGIPVGVDACGNLFVQILGGARRGEVVFLDHEYHYGMLDDADPPQLAPDIREGAPDKLLQDFTDDEFWEHMIAVDYAILAAPSLYAMIETLTAHHTALMAALEPDWRKV